MFKISRQEIEVDGKKIILETGKIARQADGAIIATCGETVVIATAVGAKKVNPDVDYFPLQVNYQEKYYAAGKIPGGYFIHGTNKPDGVGMQVSHGCIRLFPEDIRLIFSLTDIGLRVKIINEPFKIGILGNQIFLEIHDTLSPEDINSSYKAVESMIRSFVFDRQTGATIDWTKVKEIFEKKTGVPTMIAKIETKTRQLLETAG